MSLFRLDASIRTEGSNSRALADIVENAAVGAFGPDTGVQAKE